MEVLPESEGKIAGDFGLSFLGLELQDDIWSLSSFVYILLNEKHPDFSHLDFLFQAHYCFILLWSLLIYAVFFFCLLQTPWYACLPLPLKLHWGPPAQFSLSSQLKHLAPKSQQLNLRWDFEIFLSSLLTLVSCYRCSLNMTINLMTIT